MTEQISSQDKFMSRLNVSVAIIVAVIALMGSFITKIEHDASAKSSLAGNEEQKCYYDSIGAEINGAADVNYSFGTVFQLWYQYDVQLTAAKKQGDQNAIQTFTKLRDGVAKTSGLFDPKYFNAATGQVNLVRYKSDQYGTRVYSLQEEQQAAAEVSSAWAEKSSAYILQLTLLAVAGFLLGLSLMSQSKIPSLVFALSGMGLVAIIAVWAYIVFQAPIFDLRQTKATTHFAEASSLSDQKSWPESLAAFTQAIDAAGPDHPYGRAYLQRARVYTALGQFDSAIKDYQTANQLGNRDSTLDASLVWAYFQTGDFNNAITAGTEALKDSPDDLWLQQQVNIAILASGNNRKAASQYQDFLDRATQQVSKQRQLGDTASEIWWLIDEAAFQLDQLGSLLQSDVTSPVKTHISDPEVIIKTAQEIADRLRARSIALQYHLPEAALTASKAIINEPRFIDSMTPHGRYVYKVDMEFSYSGLEAGQLMIIKVYRNNVQDPSWSFNQKWSSQQTSGNAKFTISPSFSSTYIVPPGGYIVDIYVNEQRLTQGEFAVRDPNNPGAETTPDSFLMADMLDQFDFYAEDFAFSDSASNGGDYFNDPIAFLTSDEDYLDFFNETYDFSSSGCDDPNDLTCSTAAIDCSTAPDDPYCQQPISSVCESDPALSADDPNCSSSPAQACEYDSTLSSDDPNCVPLASQACEYDSALSADDPNCVPPISQACEYDSTLSADDPNCVPPASQACEYDPSLTADDPNCVPPAPQACEYDPSLSADDPNCVPPASQACEYDPSLSADDPNCVPPATDEPTQ